MSGNDLTVSTAASAELQQLLLQTANVDDFLQELATLAVTVLPGVTWCGITARRDHRIAAVASGDARDGRGADPSLSLPLNAGGHTIGAVHLHTDHAFGAREERLAGRFASEASGALALAVRLAEGAEMSEHLKSALASRAVIDQALGVVMGQNHCTAGEAFDVLRNSSQNRNVKLRDVAVEIITAVSGQPPADGPCRS